MSSGDSKLCCSWANAAAMCNTQGIDFDRGETILGYLRLKRMSDPMQPQEHEVTSSNTDILAERKASSFADALRIEIDSDPTLGFASIQNAVPVIRSLRITNVGSTALEHIEVLVDCNPRFTTSLKLRFDKLEAGEVRTFAPLDLQADHTHLFDLTEAVHAAISATALIDGKVMGSTTNQVEVL